MGCIHINIPVGTKFVRLTVVNKEIIFTKKGEYKYPCQCSCGNFCYVASSKLRTGHTKSCGCLRKDMRRLVHLDNLKSQNKTLTKIQQKLYKVTTADLETVVNYKS